MLEVLQRHNICLVNTGGTNRKIRYYISNSPTTISSVFEPVINDILTNIIMPLLNQEIVVIKGTDPVTMTIAGGVFRNYIDKQNKLYRKEFDEALSDIDIFLHNCSGIELRTKTETPVIKGNEFKLNINETQYIEYSTASLLYKDRKVQFIQMYHHLSENNEYSPTCAIEVIDSFDFICCMAGVDLVVERGEITIVDFVYHPEFPISVANKLLLLNKNSVTPLTLDRYTKYIAEYGYTPLKADLPNFKEKLKIMKDEGAYDS